MDKTNTAITYYEHITTYKKYPVNQNSSFIATSRRENRKSEPVCTAAF